MSTVDKEKAALREKDKGNEVWSVYLCSVTVDQGSNCLM